MHGLKLFFERVKSNYIYLLGLFALLLSLVVGALVIAHFQFGIDILWLKVKHHESAQYWGQIGDFIGGVLNPLLSFCALIAVLYNLSLQREELALARRDAREAQFIQNKQSAIFETQNFESVFFRLLDVHSRLASSVNITTGATIHTGDAAFSYAVRKYFPTGMIGFGYIDDGKKIDSMKEMSQKFLDERVGTVGHYFRNLYQIMKYIDGLGRASFSVPGKRAAGMDVRRTLRLYRKQRDYANMVRAQLSSSEVACLFMNCLSSQGHGLRYYVEKYSLLKTLDLNVIAHNENIKQLYNSLAYADFEEMNMDDVVQLVVARHEVDEGDV